MQTDDGPEEEPRKKVYINKTGFKTAAIIVCESIHRAVEITNILMKALGLEETASWTDFEELKTNTGEYIVSLNTLEDLQSISIISADDDVQALDS